MKQNIAVEEFLAGRRVVIAKFVAHHYKEVQNKAKKVVGIVNLYEVQFADGKAPTVQVWCPRSIQTVEQAAKECPEILRGLSESIRAQMGAQTSRANHDNRPVGFPKLR